MTAKPFAPLLSRMIRVNMAQTTIKRETPADKAWSAVALVALFAALGVLLAVFAS